MADLHDLIADLRKMQSAVNEALPDIATAVALSAKALAERNVKEHGIGDYSEGVIPIWFLEGKELNARGSGYIKNQESAKAKKKNPNVPTGFGNWGDFREVQGLQQNHVDLTYTGFMWGNMQPGEPQRPTENVAIVYLGGTNEETQNKMNWNAERYGDFVTDSLTQDNKDTLTQVGAEIIGEIIVSNLLHE